MTEIALPVLASAPVPVIRSLVSSLVGGGPFGGVTVGSFDSGPLVGVFAVVVVAVLVVSPALMSASLALFSLPIVIVLEPLEPQPAIRTAAPRATAIMPRANQWRESESLREGS